MARVILIAAALALWPAPSYAWPITCAMVRAALLHYSPAALESMARAHGMSEATIARLKRCVR